MQMNDADIYFELEDAVAVGIFETVNCYRVFIRYDPFIFDDLQIAEDMLEYYMSGTQLFENEGYVDILYTHPIVANIEAIACSVIFAINVMALRQDEWDVNKSYWWKSEKMEEILRE